MPITVDNKNGIAYLKFGYGDIGIIHTQSKINNKEKEFCVTLVDASNPNTKEKISKEFTAVPVEDIRVMMRFDDIKSIDFLIDVLNDEKQRQLENQKEGENIR